jgi:O-antigen/teichoic acid export membrane protein
LTQSSLFSDIKNLAKNSLVYGAGSVILKAIGFFLIPLYTRFLTPADYGIMAVTGSIESVLRIIITLKLSSAVTYFFFNTDNENERRKINGTIWILMTLISFVIALVLDQFSESLATLFFRNIPFSPYIRLSIWTAFFGSLSLMPFVLWKIKEKPKQYITFTVTNTLLVISLIIYLVVFRRQGAYGYIFGTFLGTMIMSLFFVIVTLRQSKLIIQWKMLGGILAYSLPLIPHAISSWLLNLSDRTILERFVSLDQIGIYSLGYQFGSIIMLISTAINYAWVPYLFKTVKEDEAHANKRIARIATYYVLVITFVALGISLFINILIILMAKSTFHGATQVTYWVLGGHILNSFYYIPVNFLFLTKNTKYVPIITLISGILNVSLNLLLVPQFGIKAAAVVTFVSYAIMLLLVLVITQRVYPIDYEFKRISQVILTAIFIFGLGSLVDFSDIISTISLKLVLLLFFPVLLLFIGFFTINEKNFGLSLLQRIRKQ